MPHALVFSDVSVCVGTLVDLPNTGRATNALARERLAP
jgi:hypothetical protein